MKKILYRVLIMIYLAIPISVFAEGYISISPSSLTIEQGSSKTFTITAYNSIGDVYIKSQKSSVASVNKNEWSTGMVGEKETKTATITVNGVSVGTTEINLTIDGATFDYDDLSNQNKTINVNVVPKSTINTTTTTKPTENNKSKNNNLKDIIVEGFELEKIDNKNYTLEVSNNVESLNIKAIAEDNKATVTGAGNHKINIGENNIKIVITSESGSKNTINLKINRKDSYYLEDLDSLLEKDNSEILTILINKDTVITKDQIEKIKKSKKVVNFNYLDENKKLIYSWEINGKDIKVVSELVTTINYNVENKKEFSKVTNYADGIYIDFKEKDNIISGTKVKFFVGNKFENDSLINLYLYNNKKISIVNNNIKVANEYIEFSINKGAEYFITMSNLEFKDTNYSVNIVMTIVIIELITILCLLGIYILRLKKKLKKEELEIPKIKENLEENNISNNF